MNGIDKIIAAVIDEARLEAQAVIADAEETAKVISEEHKARARSAAESGEKRAEKECAAIAERADSSAALVKRNVMLDAKSRMLDSVYERASQMIIDQSDADYLEVLVAIMRKTAAEQIETENATLEHDTYGEYTVPVNYVLLLDRMTDERVGKEFYKRSAEILAAYGKTLEKSDKYSAVNGGFILICGDVELSCSVASLMSRVRAETEAEVCARLFA